MSTPKDEPHDEPHDVPSSFLAIVRDLAIVCQPRALDRTTAAVYWAALGVRFPIALLRDAARRLARSSKFFPTVSEWADMAKAVQFGRRLDDRIAGAALTCEWCDDRGLVVVRYRSGEPFDIAICSCAAARFYLRAGEDFIRLRFQLTDDQRVAEIAAFDGDDA